MCRKISGSRSKKYSQVSSSKKNSRSVEPRSVSGYFSSVFLQVSNRRPDTLMSIFSSSGLRRSFNTGGGGRGLAAMGTQPTAAARANGNQAAATEAMCGGIFLLVVEVQVEILSNTASLRVFLLSTLAELFLQISNGRNKKYDFSESFR